MEMEAGGSGSGVELGSGVGVKCCGKRCLSQVQTEDEVCLGCGGRLI